MKTTGTLSLPLPTHLSLRSPLFNCQGASWTWQLWHFSRSALLCLLSHASPWVTAAFVSKRWRVPSLLFQQLPATRSRKVTVITCSINMHGNMETHTSACVQLSSFFFSPLRLIVSNSSAVAGVDLRLSCGGNGWTASLITLHPLTLIYIQTQLHSNPIFHYLWIPFCRAWYFGCYVSFKLFFFSFASLHTTA